MTAHIAITLATIGLAMVFFAWNIVPAPVVAVAASLVLYFTGVLTTSETLSGFGDPVVILIAALLAIAVGLENAGVGAWAGQFLMRHTGENETVRLVAIMTAAAVFSGLIGMNAGVAAMLPVTVMVAVRSRTAPSKLMIPLAFACLTGASLTMVGTPVNVIAATQAQEARAGHIGFFEWAILGVPQLLGTIVIVVLFGKYLLPERPSDSIPADFSAHAQTLVEQYRLGREADALMDRDSGVAEVVVARRSALIGQHAYPGMATADGALVVLAVHREGEEVRGPSVTLRAGDHLLLEGTWKALDTYVAGPGVLAVDSPETVRRQAVPLGKGAPAALAILGLLIAGLAFDLVPAAVAAVVCAALMVVTGVMTLPQMYRGIDWNTVLLIGAMIPPAIAMTTTGAAAFIGDHVADALGGFGPVAVLAGIFAVAAVISQFISNTSTALVMMPVGLATAADLHVSALPMVLSVAMGASASVLTPFANGVSLMVYGPGGYKFGDFWKLGLAVLILKMAVTVLIIPLVWTFLVLAGLVGEFHG